MRAFPDADSDSDSDSDSGKGGGAAALDPRVLADVNAACARWSARLEGAKVKVSRAWLVREERFSSLDGPKQSFKL